MVSLINLTLGGKNPVDSLSPWDMVTIPMSIRGDLGDKGRDQEIIKISRWVESQCRRWSYDQ
jgi:hypothetical protein